MRNKVNYSAPTNRDLGQAEEVPNSTENTCVLQTMGSLPSKTWMVDVLLNNMCRIKNNNLTYMETVRVFDYEFHRQHKLFNIRNALHCTISPQSHTGQTIVPWPPLRAWTVQAPCSVEAIDGFNVRRTTGVPQYRCTTVDLLCTTEPRTLRCI